MVAWYDILDGGNGWMGDDDDDDDGCCLIVVKVDDDCVLDVFGNVQVQFQSKAKSSSVGIINWNIFVRKH